MSVIPPNIVASIAQAQLTQSQRASEADAPREASARKADQRHRLQEENHEFVEDLVEASGLKVDADGRNESETRKKKRQQEQFAKSNQPEESPAPAAPGDDARARSAALLASPDDAGKPAPPPFMLDIEA